MTIEEFENRAFHNGGYDRQFDDWKIIDIHIIPDILEEGAEFDFYCSNGKCVYLLRIRLCDKNKADKLSAINDEYNDIIYFIAEVWTDNISSILINSLLQKITTI
jgi:hypothetical protein